MEFSNPVVEIICVPDDAADDVCLDDASSGIGDSVLNIMKDGIFQLEECAGLVVDSIFPAVTDSESIIIRIY